MRFLILRLKPMSQENPTLDLQSGLTVVISVLIIYGVALAGTITPPAGDPSAQFYTLSEIYTRLNG